MSFRCGTLLGRYSLAVHVSEPQAVRVEETAEGVTQALQIDDATGERLTSTLRVAPPPSVIDGIAPAER
jgi:hypothetical protein